jgi:hypothetical protein
MVIKPGVDPEGVEVHWRSDKNQVGEIKDYSPALGEVLVHWWQTGYREWVRLEDVSECDTVTIEKGDDNAKTH